MNWLNLRVEDLSSENFIGSDPVQRGTWLCLLKYCCQQENGGIIKNFSSWKDRKLQQIIAVTKEEILGDSLLWTWKDDSLVVWKYPKSSELEVKAKRRAGREYGRRQANSIAKRSASSSANSSANTKRKDKDKEIYKEKFDEFWNVYPTRNGKKVGKQTSNELFYKLPIKELDRIIKNAHNYGINNQYPKDPERFLKKDFWKDWDTPQTHQVAQKTYEQKFIEAIPG